MHWFKVLLILLSLRFLEVSRPHIWHFIDIRIKDKYKHTINLQIV